MEDKGAAYAREVVRDGRIDVGEQHEISRMLTDPEWAKGFNTQLHTELARMTPDVRQRILHGFSQAAEWRHYKGGEDFRRGGLVGKVRVPGMSKDQPFHRTDRKITYEPKVGATVGKGKFKYIKVIPRGNRIYGVLQRTADGKIFNMVYEKPAPAAAAAPPQPEEAVEEQKGGGGGQAAPAAEEEEGEEHAESPMEKARRELEGYKLAKNPVRKMTEGDWKKAYERRMKYYYYVKVQDSSKYYQNVVATWFKKRSGKKGGLTNDDHPHREYMLRRAQKVLSVHQKQGDYPELTGDDARDLIPKKPDIMRTNRTTSRRP